MKPAEHFFILKSKPDGFFSFEKKKKKRKEKRREEHNWANPEKKMKWAGP
jgi:hypothetical protein